MTAMAEGHAKLSLQNTKVSVFDAVAAIKLYEENIAVQCGYSFIEQQQKSDFESFSEQMMHFWQCLDKFIGAYVGDLSCASLPQLPEEWYETKFAIFSSKKEQNWNLVEYDANFHS